MILWFGIILRVIYFLTPKALWGDELYTYEQAHLNWPDYLSLNDVHPPIAPILYHLCPSRVIPFICGVISLWLFQRLVKDKLAVFVFAVSPYFLHLGGEMRGYGILLMLSLMVISGWKWAVPLASLTEYYGIFVLLLAPSIFLWTIPALYIAFHQMGTEQVFASARGWTPGIITILKKLSGLFIQFNGGIQHSFLTIEQAKEVMSRPITYCWFIPTIFALFSRNKKYLKLIILTLTTLFMFYAIRLNARYLPFVAVALLIISAEGYRNAKKILPELSKVLMTSYLLLLLYSASWLFRIDYDGYHREGWFECQKWLEENAKNHAIVGATRFVNLKTLQNTSDKRTRIWNCLNIFRKRDTIYELYQGNPDQSINEKHLQRRSKELRRKGKFVFKGGDLAYIIEWR